eukprot:gene12178-biopygen19933
MRALRPAQAGPRCERADAGGAHRHKSVPHSYGDVYDLIFKVLHSIAGQHCLRELCSVLFPDAPCDLRVLVFTWAAKHCGDLACKGVERVIDVYIM